MENNFKGVKVLLLEGFARQVMPMVEALHKLGCEVTTYNSSKLDMGYASRYPDRKLLAFWDRKNEDTSFAALMEQLKAYKYDIVIPLADFSAIMLAKHKDEVKQYANPAVNDWDVFVKACDKEKTMAVCMENNIPCPKTILNVKSIDDVLGKIDFPIVVKPRTGYGAIGFHCVENEDQLRKVFAEAPKTYGDMQVQEYIPQTDMQYKCELFVDGHGKVKSAVVFDKSRWYPIDGGSSCFKTTVDRPDIVKSCVDLLEAIGWRGYADVDLIQDPRDNVAKIMEINPRITGSVKICFDAGVDFARQIVEYETGREVTAYDDYIVGRNMRYLHTDILWFLKSKDRFKADPSWFTVRKTTDQIWSAKDPLPWFTYTIQGLKKFKKESEKRKRA